MTYAVDDEFGNQISDGFESHSAAKQCARRYLSAHKDAPAVTIYVSGKSETSEGDDPGDSWEWTRDEILG
jgi:hypothetical protein